MRNYWLGGLLAIALLGGWLFSQYWYYMPGIITSIVSPIGDFREIELESGPAEKDNRTDKPNIVLILVDDLGFNDITFNGGGIANGSVPTPNIDSIAKDGIQFTNGYTGNATCAPSRAALLTGRFPTRVGFEYTPMGSTTFAELVAGDQFVEENAEGYPANEKLGLPGEEHTLAEQLSTMDYHSVVLGKWHLGEGVGMSPNEQGFDEFLGFLAGAALFMEEDDENVVNSKQDFDQIDKFLWANLKYGVRYNDGDRFAPDSHMTDYFSRQAVKVIEQNRNRPFFLYLSYNAPHTPLQAEKADYEALEHIENHVERTYAGMIRGLDRGIGQVLQALEDNDISDNTMVIFVSDNGGAGYVGLPDLNKPYRGWKMTFFEGGIHTPFFIRWPDMIPAGTTYDSAVAHVDIFSTALAAAGAQPPADRIIDGVNLMEYALPEKQSTLVRPLYWRTGGYKVVMQDGWKLQLLEQNGKTWLFNLNEDPTEQKDLSASEPDMLKIMTSLLYELDEQMIEPLWPNLVEGSTPVDFTIDQIPPTEHETIIWSN